MSIHYTLAVINLQQFACAPCPTRSVYSSSLPSNLSSFPNVSLKLLLSRSPVNDMELNLMKASLSAPDGPHIIQQCRLPSPCGNHSPLDSVIPLSHCKFLLSPLAASSSDRQALEMESLLFTLLTFSTLSRTDRSWILSPFIPPYLASLYHHLTSTLNLMSIAEAGPSTHLEWLSLSPLHPKKKLPTTQTHSHPWFLPAHAHKTGLLSGNFPMYRSAHPPLSRCFLLGGPREPPTRSPCPWSCLLSAFAIQSWGFFLKQIPDDIPPLFNPSHSALTVLPLIQDTQSQWLLSIPPTGWVFALAALSFWAAVARPSAASVPLWISQPKYLLLN